MSKKKILFFGLGSIGSRHLKLLQKNFNYEIYAYRSKKGAPREGVKNLYNLNQAFKIEADIAFITNPTYLHIETAIRCLEENIKYLFIEKPLSHSLENVDYFLEKAKKLGAIVYVGYSMRFNPILRRLKEIIEEKRKKIFFARTISNSYLPNWRPGRDYRKVYSAKKELGGGIILELIHEFDYNEWFFGKIKSITGIYGKMSPLEINSEDFCNVFLEFEEDLYGTITLDFFSRMDKRSIEIFSYDELFIGDLIKNEILIINDKEIKREVIKFERDDYFEQQLKYFLDGVENESMEIDNLTDAKELLEKLVDFKKRNKMIKY